jgi:hypothetical protein
MGHLTGEKILRAWERTLELPEHEAVLALLAMAWPGHAADEWARMPLGKRNSMLLELRAATLGRRMEGFAVCPACGALLEFAVDAKELGKAMRAQVAAADAGAEPGMLRPANTQDLVAASAAADEEQARAILLARTLTASEHARLETAGVAVLETFERLNAAAEIRVELACPECPERPVLDLDIARFVLKEITGAARRLMTEIHELASAYGWSERAIACMSPARRAAYLEMLSV